MSAQDALNAIRTAGITLIVDGDQLRATPAHLLTGELRDLARAYKPLLIDLLRNQPPAHEDPSAAPERWLDEIGETDPDIRREYLDRWEIAQ